MKKSIQQMLLISLSVFFLYEINAQSVTVKRQTISSFGGSVSTSIEGKSISIQQSIGQASVTGTFSKNSTKIRQGFIQPNDKKIVSIKKQYLEYTVYPNPFSSNIQILFPEQPADELIITVHDVIGKLLISKTIDSEINLLLDYSELKNGSYFLTITSGLLTTTKKIIKS